MKDFYDKIDKLGKVKLNEIYLDSFLEFLKDDNIVDKEYIHIIEDEIVKKFIKKLSSGKMYHEEIIIISKKIAKINKAMDKIGRWYG
jgi:hypothetical protein